MPKSKEKPTDNKRPNPATGKPWPKVADDWQDAGAPDSPPEPSTRKM